tara:strand:+ start:775 stop:1047 length:273 start_codon:yes stop_codon:yes gene_type:complete
MIDEIPIIKAEALHIGIDQDTVYFTIEPSVQEAIANGSNMISVKVRGSNEGVVWLNHMGADMLTDLRHHPEHYERFLKWATQIYNRENGI